MTAAHSGGMMTSKLIIIVSAIVLSTTVSVSSEGRLPPIAWGEKPAVVIDKPYLCRGPLPIGDSIEVHMCTMSVLGREALVNLYFVDGSYACFEVTMEAEGNDGEEILLEFNGLVDRLEIAVGRPGGRDGTPGGDPRATWLTTSETIRAAVLSTGPVPIIGIVALAGEHHQRIARLVRW